MSARTILIATGNPHKLEELGAIFEPLGIRAIGLHDISGGAGIPEPVEDADTFEGNAQIKAVAYARATRRTVLADDSGLEVDVLGGAPGVRSARYAGVEGDRATRDGANNAKLLDALQDVPDEERTARFVCAICVADAEGTVRATSRGEFAGVIGREPRGSNGFGYDPLLILEDGRTSAELTPEEKNRRSHRAEAGRKIAERLAAVLGC
ncbi:MAG: RdgB/HAM1 family non-canonical purine NTP pyrophosphatase [Planctomycetota bacterium]